MRASWGCLADSAVCNAFLDSAFLLAGDLRAARHPCADGGGLPRPFPRMCSASLLFQVLTGMNKQCWPRSFLESTSRARSFEFPHRVHCLKILHWTSRGWFSLVCILQHFINSLESSCKLDGRGLRACVASTAFGLGVGGGWDAQVSGVFRFHQRRQACVSVCQRCGRMRNSLGTCGACVYVRFVFFARMACCLTALAGVSVLAW